MDAKTNEKSELCCNMWAVVKFYCLTGKTPTKMFKKWNPFTMTTVWVEGRCSHYTRKFWKGEKQLSCTLDNVVDNHLHHLPKITVNTLRILLKEDCSLSCWEMEAIMDWLKLTIENIMKKLGMQCVLRCRSGMILWNRNFNNGLMCAHIWKTNIEITHHSHPVLSHLMKHGPIVTTLRQSKNVQPGALL